MTPNRRKTASAPCSKALGRCCGRGTRIRHRHTRRTPQPESLPDDSEDAQSDIASEEADTPRKRFFFHVQMRREHQELEWESMQIDERFWGSTQSRVEVAVAWVISRWKREQRWRLSGPNVGPQRSERWGFGGAPACLLAMELEWEIENMVFTARALYIPALGRQALPTEQPTQWNNDHLAEMALYNLRGKW